MKNKNRIYLCLAKMSDSGAEQHYINEAFRTNWVVPLGPNVDGFERDLEGFVNGAKSPMRSLVPIEGPKSLPIMTAFRLAQRLA